MIGRRKTACATVLVVLLLSICFVFVQSSSSTKNADPEVFFRSLDKDADGDLDADELRRVIRETGVEQYDEHHEVEVGVQTAMSMVKDSDQALLHKDLVTQWMTLASLMSPETIGDWMTHAVGLTPSVADRFVQANWTGLDLPRLVSGNADALLAEIKASLTRAEKLKLIGAIKLRMLNVGRVPHAPDLKAAESSKSARCGVIMLSWSNPARSFPDIHKYRLYRRVARDDDLPENPWSLVFEGHTTAYTDRVRDIGPQFDYKIEAWNLVGHSIPAEIHDIVPSHRGCDSSSWFSVIFNFLMDVRMYSVNILGAFTFVYFYLKPSGHESTAHSNGHRRERSRAPSVHAAVTSTGVPISNPHPMGSFYHRSSSAGIILDSDVGFTDANGANSDQSAILPDLSSSELNNSIQRMISPQTRREYSTDRCSDCGKVVTRTTRHQCGVCLRVFCTKHTALHPHMEAKLPMMGTVVLSACGINSKCRCFECAGLPKTSESFTFENSGNNSIRTESSEPREAASSPKGKKLWGKVRKDPLSKKTAKIIERKEADVSRTNTPVPETS